jgi:hypothetical protein
MENIFKNLTQEELERANQWLRRLDLFDQRNIVHVISTLERWIHGEYCQLDGCRKENAIRDLKTALENTTYFSIFAIASTVTEKPNPTDVDLMVVTNHWVNHFNQPLISDLFRVFQANYRVAIDDQCSERYDRDSECRLIMHIDPATTEWIKPVDLVYQYDVISEQRWLAHDKEPLLIISRYGKSQEPFKLVRNPQPDVFRLSEAKKA